MGRGGGGGGGGVGGGWGGGGGGGGGGGDRPSQLKRECCWTCHRSMSATAAAMTSEHNVTCDDNIHARVTSNMQNNSCCATYSDL